MSIIVRFLQGRDSMVYLWSSIQCLCLLRVLSTGWENKSMNVCWMVAWARLIYSPFPESPSWKKSNFNLTIGDRQKVGFLLKTLKTALKRPNPQFNHTTAALLLLPGTRENPPRAICCLFVRLLINMPWLGESTHFACRQAWVWEVASSSNEGEIPNSVGEVPSGTQLKPCAALLSYLPRWRDWVWLACESSWEVTLRISLISSPFIFVLWLCCEGAGSRTHLAVVPSTLNSLELAVAAKDSLPCSFPLALIWKTVWEILIWHGDWWEETPWAVCSFSRYTGPRRVFRALNCPFSKTQYW